MHDLGSIYSLIQAQETFSGADPGFPVEGGANPPGWGPTYAFAKFPEKLHEIENILGRRGPLDPVLVLV